MLETNLVLLLSLFSVTVEHSVSYHCLRISQVNAAYKQALLRFHPDRASRTDIRKQIEAEETFKMISRLKEKLLPVSWLFWWHLVRSSVSSDDVIVHYLEFFYPKFRKINFPVSFKALPLTCQSFVCCRLLFKVFIRDQTEFCCYYTHHLNDSEIFSWRSLCQTWFLGKNRLKCLICVYLAIGVPLTMSLVCVCVPKVLCSYRSLLSHMRRRMHGMFRCFFFWSFQ